MVILFRIDAQGVIHFWTDSKEDEALHLVGLVCGQNKPTKTAPPEPLPVRLDSMCPQCIQHLDSRYLAWRALHRGG